MKSLAKWARLNEGHVKAARAYKARVATLTSERDELRDRMQNMTEEAMKLRSDLWHTTMARARVEGREKKGSRWLKNGRGRALGGQGRVAGYPG